jgi:hypothetical protein
VSEEVTGAGPPAPGLDIEAKDATLAKADQWEADALVAIKQIRSPQAAEELLRRITVAAHAVRIAKLGKDRERRWGRVRLLAERRYGELLPKKKPGPGRGKRISDGESFSGAERNSASKARKVAEVPKEAFDEYVDNDPKPTRTGLLRRLKRPSEDPHVIKWVKDKREQGWTRDRIVQASKAGTDGWPRPNRSLSDGSASLILARIKSGNTAPSKSGIKATIKTAKDAEKNGKPMGEGYLGLMKARRVILELTLELQRLDVRQFGNDDYIANLDIDTIYEELVDMGYWFELHVGWFQARAKDKTVRDKIKALRMKTVENGCEPPEAAAAEIMADKLERKLKNTLSE